MARRSWLEVAEYVALFGSFTGTLIALVSQQVAAAALPLSVSLLLNLINRSQLEDSQEQTTQTALDAFSRRYATDMKFLRRQMQEALATPEQVNLTPLESAIGELRQALNQAQQGVERQLAAAGRSLDPLQAQLAALQVQQQTLEASLSRLQQRVQAGPTPESLTAVASTLAQLQEQTRQTEAALQQWGQQVQGTGQGLAKLEAKVEAGATVLPDLAERVTELEAGRPQLVALENRLEQVDRALETLAEDVTQLARNPLAATVTDLERQVADLPQLRQQVREQQLATRQTEQDVNQVRQQLEQLPGLVADLRQVEQQVALTAGRAEDVQNLSQRLESLETLRAQVQALEAAMGQVLPRTSLLPLLAAVETLYHDHQRLDTTVQPLADGLKVLQTSLETLAQETAGRPGVETIGELQDRLANLEQRLNQLPTPPDLAPLHQELAALKQTLTQMPTLDPAILATQDAQLGNLQSQLEVVQRLVSDLDRTTLDLQEYTQDLDQRQAKLDQFLGQTQQTLDRLPLSIGEGIAQWVDEINQQLQRIQPFRYELVIDRFGSREVLRQALSTAQARLVMVCPWLSQRTLDQGFLQQLRSALQRGVRVDIGWGDLRDLEAGELRRRADGKIREGPGRFSWKYNALGDLEQLEQEFPDRFRLKLLGTHEKYLVVDQSQAMLGSHDMLAASSSLPEREVGLKTDDVRLAEELTRRFDRALDLDQEMSI
ncbi:MAG: hypothetical protein IGQ88_00270 [Gloeomargaritaceae cyanobacterium C42_A2020_066]|nr:hypothetical protein [Gloeomargaritaceae cyanobacterium C42_A2020_066]